MDQASKILRDLRAELGDQAQLLRYIPLSKVETTPSRDDKALTFAILVGSIRCNTKHIKLTVWAYLYPASRPNGHPELQFHAYEGAQYRSRFDGDVISKAASGYNDAFKLPGKCTKAKLQSMAKYYFMAKLAEEGDEEDEEKLRYGVAISKTWVSELGNICQALKDAVDGQDLRRRRASTVTVPSNAMGGIEDESATPQVNLESPPLSDPPSNLSQNERAAIPLPSDDDDDMFTSFLTLNDEEEDVKEEIKKAEEQIAALEEQRREKKERLKYIKSKKDRLVHGLADVATAFKIGEEVGRKSGTKRIKLESSPLHSSQHA